MLLASGAREEIEALEKAVAERPAAREAQRALAEELTALVHGEAQRDAGGRGQPGAVRPGRAAAPGRRRRCGAALAELPRRGDAVDGGGRRRVVELLAADRPGRRAKSAARRAVAEGGAYLNNERVTDADAVPADGDLLHGALAGAAPGQAQPRRRSSGLTAP